MTLGLSMGALALGEIRKSVGEEIYVPGTISGLITGLDISDISTITFYPPPDDTIAQTMNEKSPLALQYTTSSSSYGPVYDSVQKTLQFYSDKRLSENYATDKSLSGRKSVTIGGVIRPTSLGANTNTIFGIHDSGFESFCSLGVNYNGGDPKYKFHYSGDIFDLGSVQLDRIDSVVARHENISPGVNEYSIWVNGVKSGPLPGTATESFPAVQTMLAGVGFKLAWMYFIGFMKQVAVYNRALNDSEVSNLITFLDSKK